MSTPNKNHRKISTTTLFIIFPNNKPISYPSSSFEARTTLNLPSMNQNGPPHLAKRVLARLIAPVVVVSLLLMTVGTVAAYYVHRLQQEDHRPADPGCLRDPRRPKSL